MSPDVLRMRLGYLYSRYPVLAQTACDIEEMLELQRLGHEVIIGSIHSPLTPFRPEGSEFLSANVYYAPPARVLTAWQKNASSAGDWPHGLLRRHRKQFKRTTDPMARACEALFFAKLFSRHGVEHFRVHVGNFAAHTALFVKEITGLPFSLMAHGQGFMKELGNDDLLREICAAAEFVATETDYSRGLLAARCPDSASKIHRVYNGIDLSRAGVIEERAFSQEVPLRFLSVARLLPLKGFEVLLEACAELRRRGLNFICEIIGDGPLRGPLLSKIGELNLGEQVQLTGGMRGAQMREKLRDCDVFVLPAIVDETAQSDIFPATILDAMAFAKPVVATLVGGIPEAVVHNTTGVMVPPCDSAALADALAMLVREPLLRIALGRQARARVEQQFQIAVTVPTLVEFISRANHENRLNTLARREVSNPSSIAYLVDEWPSDRLPLLEAELEVLEKFDITPQVFVCRANPRARPSPLGARLSLSFHFLPDEMVLEGDWQTQLDLGTGLMSAFATEYGLSGAETLRHARFALSLLPRLREANVQHLHATDSRALLTALMLNYLIEVNMSAVVERDTRLSPETVRVATARCIGGRLGDRRLLRSVDGDWMFDSNAWSRSLAHLRGCVASIGGAGLIGRSKLWQEWADRLIRWNIPPSK